MPRVVLNSFLVAACLVAGPAIVLQAQVSGDGPQSFTAAKAASQATDVPRSAPASDDKKVKREPNRQNTDRITMLTPGREAAALAFVTNHHPELVELLERLKADRPRQYQSVVLDLFRTSERLAALHENDPLRHELALRAWKTRSRIQLLAARAALSDDESIRLELRRALEEQAHIRGQQLQYERDVATERLKKAETALEEFEQGRQAQIDRQYNALLRQIERSAEKSKALKNKPAKGKNSKSAVKKKETAQ
ncbi:MAG: hypothetical protein WD894_11850 [Pirellulales bacterium]